MYSLEEKEAPTFHRKIMERDKFDELTRNVIYSEHYSVHNPSTLASFETLTKVFPVEYQKLMNIQLYRGDVKNALNAMKTLGATKVSEKKVKLDKVEGNFEPFGI